MVTEFGFVLFFGSSIRRIRDKYEYCLQKKELMVIKYILITSTIDFNQLMI